jgi:hypothetical protein
MGGGLSFLKSVPAESSLDAAVGVRRERYRSPRFPLIPEAWFRPENEWNHCDWGFSWLFLCVWTGIGFDLSAKVELNDQDFHIQLGIPWLHVRFTVPLFPFWFHQKLWRTKR